MISLTFSPVPHDYLGSDPPQQIPFSTVALCPGVLHSRAMDGVPYISVPERFFGIVSSFGVVLVIGLVFADWLTKVYSQRNGLDDETRRWLNGKMLLGGFLGALVLDIVFYERAAFMADPFGTVKKLGISSYGGLVGGALAFFLATAKRKLDRRVWGDMAAWGAAGGWLFGRLGCALVHDHLGQRTDFALGVNVPPQKYPFARINEVVRAHDLGFYEFLLWIVLLSMVVLLERCRGRKQGFLLGIMAICYSIPRFFFEFLRLPQSDPRYAGLTFAQWASIGTFLIGLWLVLMPAPKTGQPTPAK